MEVWVQTSCLSHYDHQILHKYCKYYVSIKVLTQKYPSTQIKLYVLLQDMNEEACVSLTGNTYSVPVTALKFFSNILLAGMCLFLNIIELLQLLTSSIPKNNVKTFNVLSSLLSYKFGTVFTFHELLPGRNLTIHTEQLVSRKSTSTSLCFVF